MIRKLLLIVLLGFTTQLFAQDDTLVTSNLRGFYKWYINNSKGTEINPFQARITKNSKGYAEMQLKNYEEVMRTSGFFTEDFIKNEIARLTPCATEVAKHKYAKWDKLEMGEHPGCILYFDYWLQAQDVPDGIEITKVQKKGFAATAEFHFYSGSGSDKFNWETGGVASIELHNGKWLVGAIEFKK